MMDTKHAFPATSRPMQVFWFALACFWTVRLAQHAITWYKGTPTPQWDRPASGVLLSAGSLILALSFLVRRAGPRLVLIAAVFVLIGAQMWLGLF